MIKYNDTLSGKDFKDYINRLMKEMEAETDYIYTPTINEQRENGVIKSIQININRGNSNPGF